jgi:hypothetical protein
MTPDQLYSLGLATIWSHALLTAVVIVTIMTYFGTKGE